MYVSGYQGYLGPVYSDTCGVGNSNLTSFTGAFTGPVTSDMTNSFSSGTGSFTGLNSINLWFDFDHFFRGWGKSGSTFPNNTQQGPCITGNCQIWDWRIKVGGPLHKKSFTASSANVSFQTDICNIYLDGNDSITGAGGVAFMKNAVEAFSDPKGNNN